MHFCEDYVSGTIEKEKTGSVLVMRFDLLPSSILYKFLEGIKVLPDLLFFSPNLRLGSFADLFEEKKTVPTDLQPGLPKRLTSRFLAEPRLAA